MDTVLIFALALNFLWLPSLTGLFLDTVFVLARSEENYSRVMSEYGKKVDITRSTAIRWVVLPVGWLVTSYLLTNGMGCGSFVSYERAKSWQISGVTGCTVTDGQPLPLLQKSS